MGNNETLIKEIKAEFENTTTAPDTEQDIDLEKYSFDYTQDFKTPETVLEIDGIPSFTRGNISCISGKAKSRKSFLIALLAGDLIKEKKKILLIDTEQEDYHIGISSKRILTLADLPTNEKSPYLEVYALRSKDTTTRQDITKQVIKAGRYDLVFIDGIRDLVYSINDEKEATETMNVLMRLSSEQNTHICCVLHENKGDGNTRGHIGTEITHKSETVISVTKEGDFSKVEPKFCRNKEFEPFYFEVKETFNGVLPIKCEMPKPPTEQEKQVSLYQSIFSEREYKAISYTDLISEIRKRVLNSKGGMITKDTAKKRISKAVENGYIKKNTFGTYELSEKYLSKNDFTENEIKDDDIEILF